MGFTALAALPVFSEIADYWHFTEVYTAKRSCSNAHRTE